MRERVTTLQLIADIGPVAVMLACAILFWNAVPFLSRLGMICTSVVWLMFWFQKK